MLKTLNGLKSGSLDLINYADGLCDLIEHNNPYLHCYVNEEGRRLRLRNDAEELLKKYPDSSHRPPLFGLAVGVKDIYRVDGLPTRCGSALPAELFEGVESKIVSNLKEAGALISGKTETTEFAWFQPAATRNPLNLKHTPGGSSSGSAAAVAAGLAPMALGTQTIGSVIRPAAFCGVIGVKPSAGSLSTSGIIPFSKTFDQPGFFTQDLETATYIASIICGEMQKTDSNSETSTIETRHTKKSNPSAGQPLPAGELITRLVIGMPAERYLQQADAKITSSFRKQLRKIENKGHTIIRTELFSETETINKYHKALAAREFADVHKEWYIFYGHLYSDHSKKLIKDGKQVTTDDSEAIIEHRSNVSWALEKIMSTEGIDCWLSPAAVSLPPGRLASTGSPLMNLPWTYTGVPCLTIPIHDPLLPFPVGLQISGRMNGLKKLFSCAKTLRNVFWDQTS